MRWSAFTNVPPKTTSRAGASLLLSYGVVALVLSARLLVGQSATAVEPAITTLQVRTQIVLLDVAVVDKKGHPATSTLGREDFAVTEDGKPQQLLTFEAPARHATAVSTVFVLDELNTSLADNAYYRICLAQYLRMLPEILPAPSQLMVLSISSLRMVQSPTRSRAELLSTLLHLPSGELTSANMEPERFSRTFNALQSIALESLGNPGRTAVVWLGPGDGVDVNTQPLSTRPQTQRFVRYLTNTMLQSRMTLYVVFPPGFSAGSASHLESQDARSQALSAADPYDGGINFRTLAAQTGGSVYTATNDLATAMRDALDLGRGSYTLGYRPDDTGMDAWFRRIRVTLRNANLRIITKSGYYAPESEEGDAPQTIQIFQMTEAGKSTLPFRNLELRITHIERSLDGKTAEFTILAEGKSLSWQSQGQEESLAELTVGGLSLSKERKKLSSTFRNVNMLARSQDPAILRETTASFKLTVAIPSETDRVRLVVSSRSNGRLGCVDASRAAINSAAVKVGAPNGI